MIIRERAYFGLVNQVVLSRPKRVKSLVPIPSFMKKYIKKILTATDEMT
jgi:hypothetical protein